VKIRKIHFGTLGNGQLVNLYTVSNGKMSFSVSDFGCTITSILLPDRFGGTDDVVLGFSTFDDYVRSAGVSFGTVVGRYANRIGGASFSLGRRTYELDHNDGPNCLHGGFDSFDKKSWRGVPVRTARGTGVRFMRISPDGEQKFPGTVTLCATFLLNHKNELFVEYDGRTNHDTPISLTNHTYFNLAGHEAGSVCQTSLQLFCSSYIPTDEKLIPDGRILPVLHTPYDFTTPKLIGKDIGATDCGYDHCYVTPAYEYSFLSGSAVSGKQKPLIKTASVYEPVTGRRMEVDTNQEGIQFYTANWIEGIRGKNGVIYHNHDAFCLETECFPDSPNKQDFPSVILHPDEEYHARTVYRFFL
jgi:aldose 1-epimerase